MDYVIRRRKSGSMKRGIIQPLEINCNRELVMLDNEERIELLSPASAAFHKPDFNIHVLAIMGVKVPVNVELLKAKFPSTLCKHPRFSSVVEGNPCKGEKLRWTRTEVNLDKHIIVPKINPENIDSPEKYVEDYIYNLSKTTLDKSRPLWDVHVLNLKLSEDVKAVTVFRVHHSLGDGTSLISLLLALTRKTSDPEALPTIPASKLCNDDNNNNNNTRKGLFWKWAIALWMILKLFWNTSIDILLFVATTLFLKDNCPFKSSPEGANAPRRVVYKIFSLDDMKFVKNAIGGTINDVAVGITQAGLSQYLYRKYGNKGDTNEDTRGKMKRFLSNIRLRSVLLVNIRPSGGVQVASVISDRINSHTTMGFSNLPGPVEDVAFYGLPLAFVAPSSYGQPHAVLINFQSYSDKMTIVLAVDEYTVPDPHQLCDDIVDSLKLIKDAVIKQGIVKPSCPSS
ncbi:wax ester synthase/diacylglycerol acyltransferase 5 isoform X2 [Beta vulgaris subsp. vulgaris]|uniref:wax ester synthase/diacylglycerol acyltransferase 5 isoform X2 n=1 Tax=Beta vulgaris subsp. vulgaris TaxID=3555 RepID=UPI002036E1FD|nr:wax ester synthase/diacylglycerol acyltransferase 5 isoform X2 [Beta vulgaris subsp. vulgaris]